MTKQDAHFNADNNDLTRPQSLLISFIRKELSEPNGSTNPTLRRVIMLLRFHDIGHDLGSDDTHNIRSYKPRDPKMDLILQRVEREPFSEWNVATLSREFGKSRSSFSNEFKETTGTSPMKYIRQLRIQQACELLKNRELSIEQIAFDVGYSDANSFSRAFCRQMGIAPGAYRQQS